MRAALSEGRSSVRDMSTESRPGVVRVAGLGLSWVGVEASTMRGAEAVAVMRGCFHRRNRGTADLLRAMHVAGRATAGTGARRALLDDFSGDEVGGALGWSRSMASRWLDLADDLVSRLCEVLTAMDGGALVVSKWTRDLSDDHAHALCADVLPGAPGLSVGALIERMATAPGSLAAPGSRSATPVPSRTALHPTAQTPTARRTSSTTLPRPVACVRGRSRSGCACPQHSASTISRRAFRGGV